MRTWLLGLSSILIACGGSSGGGDDVGLGPATKILLKPSGGGIDLVAFRHNRDTDWQVVTADATGAYTFEVNAPYWVSVACHDTYPDASSYSVHQLGRTLSDPAEIDGPFCSSVLNTSTVSGTIGASGSVMIGDNETFTDAQGAFEMRVTPGSYTLYAASADRVLIAHDVTVGIGTTLPPLDISQGTALVAASFTATNAATSSDVQLQVAAIIGPAGHPELAVLPFYIGAPATAKVLPDATLTSADYQSVSFREFRQGGNRTQTRAYRKPYKLGDSTSFTLPDPIEDLTWSTGSAPVSVGWSSLPDMPFDIHVEGLAGDGSSNPREHVISLTASFLQITGSTHVELETDLPGFQTGWGVDPKRLTALNTYGQIASEPSTSPVISVSDEQTLDSLD